MKECGEEEERREEGERGEKGERKEDRSGLKKVGSREKGKNQVRERREGRELKGRSGRWE